LNGNIISYFTTGRLTMQRYVDHNLLLMFYKTSKV